MLERKLTDWLPTTQKEVELRGWASPDVILFSGDAYVDHPSFGAAVIGRTLEHLGLKVALVPQPNWRDDWRDFRKLGKPRLFFAVSAGAMDSMVNKYTANKRLRSEDAYTPDARTDMRPDYPTIVYSQILKKLYPDMPVIVGGIEASMRRLAHYDYWQDKLLPSILVASQADLLIYGCGENPIADLTRALQNGARVSELTSLPQTVFMRDEVKPQANDRIL
ncbi:MAG: YgiQ family radical SAM protein, partial [Dysgonamonadaceae bacterium]|nr:YgiQ family radical SAM protein [Dysgonamonadaceae bacterium]